MRRSDIALVFAVIALTPAVPAFAAAAAGMPAASKLMLAQANVYEPRSPVDELLARAKSLSSSGKYLDAYELLAQAEDAYIGIIEFDYALGRAALEAGRPEKATLALSRVLALEPNHAGAMIDIGRAYVALGNYEQARVTFETLLGLNPPPAVRTQLQAYLEQTRAAGMPAASKLMLVQANVYEPRSPVDELLARAKSLSSSGKFLDAYELLAQAEDAYIGIIEFDYALGRAALEAGRPEKATLALSRVLALEPNHAGAMIDIGRAYVALGNYEQARVTFETLLGLNPPPAVRAQLQAYLEQARAAGQGRSPKSVGRTEHGYLAAVYGRSSNVNQSPGQPDVFIPAFGATYQLSNQNVRKADGFAGLMGGVDASLPMNDTYSLIVGGDVAERRNNHESAFDLGGLGARVGIAAATQAQLLRVQLFTGRDYLGGSPSRDMNALGLEYFSDLGDNSHLLAFAQAGRLRYLPEGLKIFDANFDTLGIGASRKIAGDSTAFVTISTGDMSDVGGNPSGDERQLGVRVGADIAIFPRLRLMGNAAWQRGRYDRFDPSFLTERLDFLTNFELTLQYALARRTSLRFGLVQTDQRSNISIYEYDRTELSLSLRNEFP